ncbi:MAG: hypothetical protein ACLT5P_12050 [Flavonifractor plautii]
MAKGIMYIDSQRVPFDEETNVLLSSKAGIEMPTFTITRPSVYGACRMCVWGGGARSSLLLYEAPGWLSSHHTARL